MGRKESNHTKTHLRGCNKAWILSGTARVMKHKASHLSLNHEDPGTLDSVPCIIIMQQQWGINEMLVNVMTQTRVSDVFIL